MKERVLNIIFTVAGTVLLALSTSLFIMPYNILSGGVAGISIILEPFIPFVSKALIASAVSIILYVTGTVTLGKEFALKTGLSTLIYSPLLIIFEKTLPVIDIDPLIACLYGGLLGGFGIGLVVRRGGSTGGMDVPPLLMNKYLGIDLSKGILLVDGLTVFMGLLEYDISNVLLGLISVYFSSIGVSKALEIGGTKAKEIKIISGRYKEIIAEIHESVDRGTTIIDAKGGYTDEERNMIMCIADDKETSKIIDIVNRYDESAFVVVSDVTNVHGEGFSANTRI